MKGSFMWFSKIDEFTCQESKVTLKNIKNYFRSLDLLKFENIWSCDSRGFNKRYVQFSLSMDHLGTTGVTCASHTL